MPSNLGRIVMLLKATSRRGGHKHTPFFTLMALLSPYPHLGISTDQPLQAQPNNVAVRHGRIFFIFRKKVSSLYFKKQSIFSKAVQLIGSAQRSVFEARPLKFRASYRLMTSNGRENRRKRCYSSGCRCSVHIFSGHQLSNMEELACSWT